MYIESCHGICEISVRPSHISDKISLTCKIFNEFNVLKAFLGVIREWKLIPWRKWLKRKMVCPVTFNHLKQGEKVEGVSRKVIPIEKWRYFKVHGEVYNQIVHNKSRIHAEEDRRESAYKNANFI